MARGEIKKDVRWQTADFREVPEDLSAYDFITSQLLLQRGILTKAAAEKFLRPRLEDLADPRLLLGMDVAIQRIHAAINAKECIVIYGDYDVDGVTSATLLTAALKQLGAQVDVYLPERLKEGYGLNSAAVQKLSDEGCRLLITVDNGTTNVEEIDLAKSLGMDVIVIDHHQIPENLPTPTALLNPRLPESQYPFIESAAVGVTYHLVRALIGEADARQQLDLVALGTIADIVPLVGDNRTFAIYGLEVLNKTKRPGLKALIDVAGLKGQELSVHHIGFQLGPRINAAGRLDHAKLAFDLLNADTETRAYELAKELNQLNMRRQDLTDQIMKAARTKAAELEDKKVIVVAGEEWSIGVAGIVAGRLVEEFHKPALVFELQADHAKGSCRSVDGVHILQLLGGATEFIEHFGGHAKAAGLTVAHEHFDNFKAKLENLAEMIDAAVLKPCVKVDILLDASLVTSSLLETIERFAPFGFGNSTPVFGVRNMKLFGREPAGFNGSNLRLTFVDDAGRHFQVTAFESWQLMFDLKPEEFYDVAFTVGTSEVKGRKYMQLKLCGIKAAEPAVVAEPELVEALSQGQLFS